MIELLSLVGSDLESFILIGLDLMTNSQRHIMLLFMMEMNGCLVANLDVFSEVDFQHLIQLHNEPMNRRAALSYFPTLAKS